jgi:hypothetical protein
MSAPIQPSLPPTTTYQDDITKAAQRKVNLIWEYTQAIIAIAVVIAVLIVAIYSVLNTNKVTIPPELTNTMFLIVGFYFSRTNHSAIGGVGRKTTDYQEYMGR